MREGLDFAEESGNLFEGSTITEDKFHPEWVWCSPIECFVLWLEGLRILGRTLFFALCTVLLLTVLLPLMLVGRSTTFFQVMHRHLYVLQTMMAAACKRSG